MNLRIVDFEKISIFDSNCISRNVLTSGRGLLLLVVHHRDFRVFSPIFNVTHVGLSLLSYPVTTNFLGVIGFLPLYSNDLKFSFSSRSRLRK